MESEDEVDVEGDCDFTSRNDLGSVFSDTNEPPSKMALLQPEILQHPWALEQGWSLDQSTDEKSKAVIEKMLLEEQSYLEGFDPSKEYPESSFSFSTETQWVGKPSRRLWTEEEKSLFEKGIEIFGKKWSKIAELIPSRTSEQVKHYGYSYFRKKEMTSVKPETTSSSGGHYASSLKEMLTAVTTAKPTVNPLPRKQRKERPSKFNIIVKDETLKNEGKSQDLTEKFPESEVVRIQMQSDDESEEIDIEDEEPLSRTETTLLGSKRPDTAISTDTAFGNLHKMETDIGSKPGKIEEMCDSLMCEQIKTNNKTGNFVDLYSTKVPNGSDCLKQCSEIPSSSIFSEGPKIPSCSIFSAGSNLRLQGSEQISPSNSRKPPASEEFSCEIDNSSLLENFLQSKTGCTSGYTPAPTTCVISDDTSDCNNGGMLSNNTCTTSMGESTSEISFKIDPYVGDEQLDELTRPNENSEFSLDTEGNETQDSDESLSEDDEVSQDCTVVGSDGKVFCLPNPLEEKVIDREVISEEEKEIFVEFFDGRPGVKDAERYCRIRNYILDMWESCRPSYLYKTRIRGGLKRCGDVNIIGRIHAYLEQVGAINYGCDQVQYKARKVKRTKKNRSPTMPLGEQLARYKKEALRQRRRKVRDMFGSWVDEKDKEGTTIDHSKPPESKEKPTPRKNKAVKHQYDPFKLIPCQDFTPSVPAPFDVHIDLTALIVMDLHAHLSKTEVIGLLGGIYDSKKRLLKIMLTEPCDSLSTGMQCEMDPVSQTEAKERIASQKMQVVGWYHSHPTFEPNPSVRDIETQECFQEWFAAGKCPFIGVIINPIQ